MRAAKYRWLLPNEADQAKWQPLIAKLSELELPEQLAPFLWKRNIKKPEQVERFFWPKIEDLPDPFLLSDMEKALRRIRSAVEKGEHILVYGDYDADGITSTTVLKEALELIGANVEFYLPNRFIDGYGPNQAVFERMIASGITLIITVDNGVAGHEAIQFAQEQGTDVIVTDHHELPAELPPAFAIIHPRHPDGAYPFPDLAGVGVAFKLATALLEEVPYELLDLVAIGTIADLVSLTGENRLLVQLGLKAIHQTERPGIQALCQVAGIKLTSLTEKDIGFSLAPRLNALGRLGDAAPGVQLLTSFSEEEAMALAEQIQQKNEERQAIVTEITQEALQLLPEHSEHAVQILAKAGWHEGVLGIVASRLVKDTGKPTIVLTIDQAKGVAKGSGRSIADVNLFAALAEHADLFTRFGGHHMAVGLTMPIENIAKLQIALDDFIAAGNYELEQGEPFYLDGELKTQEVQLDYIASVARLAPFGTDNPEPIFLFRSAKVEQIKQVGAENRHLKFQLVQENVSLDVIGFQFGREQSEFSEAEVIDAVGRLSVNEWNGHKKPQLLLQDFRVNSLQVFDKRGSHFPADLLKLAKTTIYLVFQKAHLSLVAAVPAEQIFCVETSETTERLTQDWQELVVVDCPANAETLKELVAVASVKRIYFSCISPEQYYLVGMPDRQHFAQLFQFVSTYHNVDVRNKLSTIAAYLNIKQDMLEFMIRVFFELNFVKIEDGILNKQTAIEHRQLDESAKYQQREQQIKTEEFLLFSDIKSIKTWLQT